MFWKRKARFWTDAIYLVYTDAEAGAEWWISTFGAKRVALPEWDDPLPNDIAVQFPDGETPSICISTSEDVRRSGLDRASTPHPVVVCNDIELASQHCQARGASPTAIHDGRGPRYFEITDPDGNLIEICEDV